MNINGNLFFPQANDWNQKKKDFSPNKKNKLFYGIKGSHLRAYEKLSLGSIPRSIETILLYDPTVEEKIGFNSKSQRFKTESNDRSKQSSTYDNITSSIANLSKNISPKIINTKPKIKNYDSSRELLDRNMKMAKYYPGPGDYDPKISKSKSNLRYQSLYPISNIIPYKIKSFDIDSNPNVGPGTYDILPSLNFLSKNQVYYPYISRAPREDEFSKINSNPRVGPGTYNITGVKIKKDNGNPSYFFMEEKKSVNLEDKYIQKKDPIISVNEIRDKDNRQKNPTELKLLKEEIIKEYDIDINNKQKDNLKFKKLAVFDHRVKEEPTNIYNHGKIKISIAKSKRFADSSNHIPGPCYYNNNGFSIEKRLLLRQVKSNKEWIKEFDEKLDSK